jgi:hypothetical protein
MSVVHRKDLVAGLAPSSQSRGGPSRVASVARAALRWRTLASRNVACSWLTNFAAQTVCVYAACAKQTGLSLARTGPLQIACFWDCRSCLGGRRRRGCCRCTWRTSRSRFAPGLSLVRMWPSETSSADFPGQMLLRPPGIRRALANLSLAHGVRAAMSADVRNFHRRLPGAVVQMRPRACKLPANRARHLGSSGVFARLSAAEPGGSPSVAQPSQRAPVCANGGSASQGNRQNSKSLHPHLLYPHYRCLDSLTARGRGQEERAGLSFALPPRHGPPCIRAHRGARVQQAFATLT